MADYLDKWKTDFPETVNNQTRPKNGIDNSLAFNTDGFPQRITSDPVHAKLENDIAQQLFSNDQRLKEAIDSAGNKESNHEKASNAHANGIAGNAGSATKLATARTIQTNLSSTSAASFNGTTNITPGVTGTLPVGNGGTGQTNLDKVTVGTSKKVHTTVSSNTVSELVKASINGDDSFRIAVGGSTDSGWVELATADDGTEPIYVRQYADAKNDGFVTPTRTATLLDAGGNTSFPGKVTAPTFVGSLNGNANTATTATKLQTARIISLTGNASGSTTFDGSGNASINTTVNAIKSQGKKTAIKDGTAEPSGLKLYEVYNNGYPTIYGNLISIGGLGGGELLAGWSSADHGVEHLYYRNRRDNGKLWSNWSTILDSANYNSFAPTKTGGGASGNWGINISGNAASASKLSTARKINITGNATGSATFDGSGDVNISTTVNESKHAVNADVAATADNADKLTSESGSNYLTIDTDEDRWSVIGPNPGAWLKSIRTNNKAPAYSIGSYSAAIAFGIEDTKGIITHAFGTPNVKFAGGNGSTARWKFSIYGGFNNEVYDLNDFPTKTGGGASGTWGINISGNAASATNADTVDRYHASDLLRILGGNRTPVITDIFDRAGTIDMSTMSAADKAKHKANINKASNVTQDIWNNSTGIRAYGGDLDIAGYSRGALKLTQSWRNFDKLMIVYTDDDGNWERVRTFDVYEFNYCMTNMHSFNILFTNSQSWHVYGLTNHGTDSSFIPSTETILSCRSQNCGIIGIYGIKF